MLGALAGLAALALLPALWKRWRGGNAVAGDDA